MSEITTVPDSLGSPAAPLGVIVGVVPLGIASGNGAGFPATFIVAAVVLLLFATGFTAMTPYVDDAGAFFSYVRQALGFPAGIEWQAYTGHVSDWERRGCLANS
jgi:hypothetical protein